MDTATYEALVENDELTTEATTTSKRPSPNKDDVTEGPVTKRALVSPEEKKDEMVEACCF